MSEYFDVFEQRPELLFYDPQTQDIAPDIKRAPDYDSDTSRFQFIVEIRTGDDDAGGVGADQPR